VFEGADESAQFTSSGWALKWSSLSACRRASIASISAFLPMKAFSAASSVPAGLLGAEFVAGRGDRVQAGHLWLLRVRRFDVDSIALSGSVIQYNRSNISALICAGGS
jgi:hypothetical protein